LAKFKAGDKVKVRTDTTSPYRGRIGVINGEPSEDSFGLSYSVKFEARSATIVYRFFERDLEEAN
jgi:hypothetical protein